MKKVALAASADIPNKNSLTRFDKSDENARMNWKQLLADLRMVMTLQDIADTCGLASKGAVHDIASGRQKTVMYEIGACLIALHAEQAKTIAAVKRASKVAA